MFLKYYTLTKKERERIAQMLIAIYLWVEILAGSFIFFCALLYLSRI